MIQQALNKSENVAKDGLDKHLGKHLENRSQYIVNYWIEFKSLWQKEKLLTLSLTLSKRGDARWCSSIKGCTFGWIVNYCQPVLNNTWDKQFPVYSNNTFNSPFTRLMHKWPCNSRPEQTKNRLLPSHGWYTQVPQQLC